MPELMRESTRADPGHFQKRSPAGPGQGHRYRFGLFRRRTVEVENPVKVGDEVLSARFRIIDVKNLIQVAPLKDIVAIVKREIPDLEKEWGMIHPVEKGGSF